MSTSMGGVCFHFSACIDADKGAYGRGLNFSERLIHGDNYSPLHSNYCTALQHETASQLVTIYGVFDCSKGAGGLQLLDLLEPLMSYQAR